MDDALAQTKRRLTWEHDRNRKLDIDPLVADQWVVSSLLQKSIRRGETETAQRAAFTIFAQKGSAIWRRFMVIAFEDVGAASLDAAAITVTASTDPNWRKEYGGDQHIAVQLARVLAEAPKSRSAEHLITSAQHHPSLAKTRMLRGPMPYISLRRQIATGKALLTFPVRQNKPVLFMWTKIKKCRIRL
jgi:replication-associated recombination protein RarA